MVDKMLAVLALERQAELRRQAERHRLIRAARPPRGRHRKAPALIPSIREALAGVRWTATAARGAIREIAAMEATGRGGPRLGEYPLARRPDEPVAESSAC